MCVIIDEWLVDKRMGKVSTLMRNKMVLLTRQVGSLEDRNILKHLNKDDRVLLVQDEQ